MAEAAVGSNGVALRVGDETLRVERLAAGIWRVRRFPEDSPPVTPLLRYGFFRDDWPAEPVELGESDSTVTLRADEATVTIDRPTGRLQFGDGAENLLTLTESGPGCRARFELQPEDRFFGLGDQTRDRLEHRGHGADLWVRNVTGYIPIPFVWNPRGYGLLVNTTRRLKFDFGQRDPARFGFETDGGTLDCYLFRGASPLAILERYTALTGRPPLPPKWTFGLIFVSRTQANDKEFLDDCLNFRRAQIPCDGISLEPGWMAKNYDFSVDKDWHPERFPVAGYARYGRHTFLAAARRMGFKPGLWLCCDYDLSEEEERRLASSEGADETTVERPEDAYEDDEHLNHARRLDPWTRPGVPWYQHLTDFVDQGVEWYKQDGANQVLDHPDRLYANGMRDDEMHNLYPLLYAKQQYLGFKEHTGRRPFNFTPSGWAGLQRWTHTWTGDTGGEERPLAACLNLSLSGHGLTTPDMEATTPEGVHFGFLGAWAQLNSWNYFRHPWYQGAEQEALIRFYANLRYRLIPYLYSCAWDSTRTGTPLMRAMPLDFPEDPETHNLRHQYLLGPSLLVAAFTPRCYVPTGLWCNIWTDQELTGGRWHEPEIPADRGGPFLARAGAIVPLAGAMNYVGEKPETGYTVHLFPSVEGEETRFTLYEDDGTTFGYETGACRITVIRMRGRGESLAIEIEAAVGGYEGAPERRRWRLRVHGAGARTVELGEWAAGERVDWRG